MPGAIAMQDVPLDCCSALGAGVMAVSLVYMQPMARHICHSVDTHSGHKRSASAETGTSRNSPRSRLAPLGRSVGPVRWDRRPPVGRLSTAIVYY